MMKKSHFLFILLSLITMKVHSQKVEMEYTRRNAFTNYPDNIQLVANIGGNHHLLGFTYKEEPVIFIYDNELTLLRQISLPFKFSERSVIQIVPFDKFYYLYIHSPFTGKNTFWKIDAAGNFIEMSGAFQKLLDSQSGNIKLGFQLIPNLNELCMVYHTSLTNLEKATIVMVQTDSLLNVVFTHKIMYDFKREEEKLQQEVMMFGRYLLVLKTARGGTSLELMKVNLASGFTIRNTFSSSGYLYSQSAFNYNHLDSTVTVSSLLTEPRIAYKPKRFVFVSRLNKILMEQVSFGLLKSQFSKNTNTDFLLVDSSSKWVRLRAERQQLYNITSEEGINLYHDYTTPNSTYPDNATIRNTNPSRYYSGADAGEDGVRFSLLDKNFKITSDSLVANTRNSYTINSDKFTRFAVNNKEYMLVSQRFHKKSYGLLMVYSNDRKQLVYTDVRVNDRNNYLLSHAQVIQNGIIVPYTNKREAGLVKIIID